MPRLVELPAEFGGYANPVEYVQKVSRTEHSSSCPKCGGYPHPDGELPNRLRWFTADHQNSRVGRPHGWCRRCGGLFWPDDGAKPPSAAELERSRQEGEEAARRAKQKIEESIRLLQAEKK